MANFNDPRAMYDSGELLSKSSRRNSIINKISSASSSLASTATDTGKTIFEQTVGQNAPELVQSHKDASKLLLGGPVGSMFVQGIAKQVSGTLMGSVNKFKSDYRDKISDSPDSEDFSFQDSFDSLEEKVEDPEDIEEILRQEDGTVTKRKTKIKRTGKRKKVETKETSTKTNKTLVGKTKKNFDSVDKNYTNSIISKANKGITSEDAEELSKRDLQFITYLSKSIMAKMEKSEDKKLIAKLQTNFMKNVGEVAIQLVPSSFRIFNAARYMHQLPNTRKVGVFNAMNMTMGMIYASTRSIGTETHRLLYTLIQINKAGLGVDYKVKPPTDVTTITELIGAGVRRGLGAVFRSPLTIGNTILSTLLGVGPETPGRRTGGIGGGMTGGREYRRFYLSNILKGTTKGVGKLGLMGGLGAVGAGTLGFGPLSAAMMASPLAMNLGVGLLGYGAFTGLKGIGRSFLTGRMKNTWLGKRYQNSVLGKTQTGLGKLRDKIFFKNTEPSEDSFEGKISELIEINRIDSIRDAKYQKEHLELFRKLLKMSSKQREILDKSYKVEHKEHKEASRYRSFQNFLTFGGFLGSMFSGIMKTIGTFFRGVVGTIGSVISAIGSILSTKGIKGGIFGAGIGASIAEMLGFDPAKGGMAGGLLGAGMDYLSSKFFGGEGGTGGGTGGGGGIFSNFLGSFGGVLTGSTLIGVASKFAPALKASLKGVPFLGSAAILAMEGWEVKNGKSLSEAGIDAGIGISGTLAGAKTGAMIGAIAGPFGAALGGVLGALSGAILSTYYSEDIKKLLEEKGKEFKTSIKNLWNDPIKWMHDRGDAATELFSPGRKALEIARNKYVNEDTPLQKTIKENIEKQRIGNAVYDHFTNAKKNKEILNVLDKTWGQKPNPIEVKNTSSMIPNVEPKVGKSKITLKNIPPEYIEWVNKYSAMYGVDPRLSAAVIKAESNWNPNAVSSAGAVGLMQLMPGTAKEVGVTDRNDPEQNIRGGIKYLAKSINLRNGDIALGVAGYNAGPHNDSIEHGYIPQNGETPEYVKRVLKLYNGDDFSLFSGSSSNKKGTSTAEINNAPSNVSSFIGNLANQWDENKTLGENFTMIGNRLLDYSKGINLEESGASLKEMLAPAIDFFSGLEEQYGDKVKNYANTSFQKSKDLLNEKYDNFNNKYGGSIIGLYDKVKSSAGLSSDQFRNQMKQLMENNPEIKEYIEQANNISIDDFIDKEIIKEKASSLMTSNNIQSSLSLTKDYATDIYHKAAEELKNLSSGINILNSNMFSSNNMSTVTAGGFGGQGMLREFENEKLPFDVQALIFGDFD